MPAETDLDQRIAGRAKPLLALPFQPDRLAVLDIGRQLDRDLAPVREHGGHLRRGRGLLDCDVERHVDVAPGRRLAGTACAARAPGRCEKAWPKISLKMSPAPPPNGSAPPLRNSKRVPPRAGLLAPEAGEGIAACAAFKALEARLALAVDLAAVEGRAALLVAHDLIGLIGRGETILGLGIVGILVRMMLLGELAVSRLYVLGRGVLGNAQHLIGIAHCFCLRIREFGRLLYALA